MNELVSVVIPTYKRKDAFNRAINSVLKQTYENIEIIVVDDNVDEDISEYVQKSVENLQRNSNYNIQYIKNEQNLGGALTRNEGLKAAKGTYVAFLDDDDEYLEKNIEKKVERFKKSNDGRLALVYGWCESRNSEGETLVQYKNNTVGNCIFEAMYECVAATTQWLCKRDALLDVDGFTDVPSKQDSTLILKLLYKGYTLDRVSEVLTIYYEHNEGRISSGNLRNLQGEIMLRNYMREHYGLLSEQEKQQVEGNISLRIMILAMDNKKYTEAKEEYKDLINNRYYKKQARKIHLKKYIKKRIMGL